MHMTTIILRIYEDRKYRFMKRITQVNTNIYKFDAACVRFKGILILAHTESNPHRNKMIESLRENTILSYD